ncbi:MULTISPECIES: MFS transporter [unclassified Streptomyces]|uniref:MFS transporter n=1 Tax=unclassified Streptomyces TaxID=2593676 RepID=UPI00225B5C1F|nr:MULTISPECIES: MFS transporter [unclassified Streptomyces]MCX4529800.1 MFS transporter [Streptomyces sp. NBC_01551]MCX4539628.1 MFS transporter [Streptomyces sp. NBC_01565]
MIVALDGTVLVVAQPSLRRDLGASVAQVQWTSTAYLLTVAAFLVIAGRLGDRYGHPRLLLIGVLGFAAASAGIALAPGVGWVIALRAAQGVFGALLQPATLALLRLAYPPDRLGRPVAIRTSAIGVAAAAGPLLGGLLVARLGWRAVFVVNVPVALVIAALTLALRIPAPPRTEAGRPELGGAALLAAALAVLVHALAGVPAYGWTAPRTLLGLGGAALLAALLVRRERRAAHPLVPPAVARSAAVTASMALLLAVSAGMFGALFAATFLLQDVRGLDALGTGLRVLPLTAVMVAGAPVAGVALRRFGARRTALVGTGLVACGIAALAAPALTEAGFAVLGAGFAAVMVTATGTVVGDAPAGYAGVVSGLKQTAMNVGPTLGIALAAGAGAGAGTGAGAGAAGAAGPALLTLAALAAVGLLPASLLPGGARGAAAGDLVGEDAGQRGEGAPAAHGPADRERR